MLPWLFAILLLLNVGLFVWGYQHEKSLEPPPTPVPVGMYEIRLLGERPAEQKPAPDEDKPNARTEVVADGETVASQVSEDAAHESEPADESDIFGENPFGKTSVALEDTPSDETTEAAPESMATTARAAPRKSESEPAKSRVLPEVSPATDKEDTVPVSAPLRSEATRSKAPVVDVTGPTGAEMHDTEARVLDASKQLFPESPRQNQSPLSSEDQESKVPDYGANEVVTTTDD